MDPSKPEQPKPGSRGPLIAAVALLAIGGVGLLWYVFFRSPPTPPPGTKEITICQFGKVFIYLPLYVADERGFFKDEGLSVKLINGGGDEKTFAAVVSGEAQFGVADPTFTAIAREKGQPGVVIASVVSGATFWGVTRREMPPVKEPAQLKDLRIATYTAPSTNYTLMAKTLRDNKAAVGNARIVEGQFGTLLAMLDKGEADIAMELEPTASLAVKGGAKVVYSYPEMYGPFLLTGLYAMEDYRNANPEVCQKVVNAMERAVRYCHADPAGATEVARKVFPEVPGDVLENAVRRLLADKTIPEHATIDLRGWENAVGVRVSVGDLKDREAAKKTIDNSFAEKAAAAAKP